MRIICFLILAFSYSFAFAQKRETLKVHFDLDRHEIRQQDAALLDSMLLAHAGPGATRFEIYGHCDLRGSDAYNDVLAMKRVRAVEAYLLKKGIGQQLISIRQGFGKRQPLTNEPGEAKQALNRRVELAMIIPGKVSPTEVIPVEKPIETPKEKPGETRIEIPSGKTLEKTIRDSATKVGSKIIMKNLNFYGGRDILLEISEPALMELVQVMKNNPKLAIRIDGHICCLPGDTDSTDLATGIRNLSVARARAIYEHLIRNGISRSRLSYMGWGHRNPIYPYPEKSALQQAMNRRVEIFIVSK